MSNYPSPQLNQYQLPPHAPVQPKRNPRSGRKRGGRRKKKTALFTFFQKCVLLFLCLCILVSGIVYLHFRTDLLDLNAQKNRLLAEYDNLVSRHIVKYRDHIEHYAAVYEINPAFVAAIIYRESHYDPEAVSYVGARGLMQLMPDTGTWMAEKAGIADYDHDDLFDPETNIRLGTRYLHYLSGKFDGDPILVACSFHAGAGNVESWIENYSSNGQTLTLDEIPMDDTQSYARKVMESYAVYLQHVFPDGGVHTGADAGHPVRTGVSS